MHEQHVLDSGADVIEVTLYREVSWREMTSLPSSVRLRDVN